MAANYDGDYFLAKIASNTLQAMSVVYEFAPVERGTAWRRTALYKDAKTAIATAPFRVFVSPPEAIAVRTQLVTMTSLVVSAPGRETLIASSSFTVDAFTLVAALVAAGISFVYVESFAMKSPLEHFSRVLLRLQATTGFVDISHTIQLPTPVDCSHLPAFSLSIQPVATSEPRIRSVAKGPLTEEPTHLLRGASGGLERFLDWTIYPTFAMAGSFAAGGFTLSLKVIIIILSRRTGCPVPCPHVLLVPMCCRDTPSSGR